MTTGIKAHAAYMMRRNRHFSAFHFAYIMISSIFMNTRGT